MEGNRDEALRCLSIAQKHRNAGNYTSARKFIQKSLALFTTPEAEKLAQIIDSEASASTSTSKGTEEATKATGTEKHPSAGGTHHRHPNGNASTNGSAEGSSSASEKKRDYTPDQLAVVKRVRTCKVTEYYEILALKRDCEEAEVKKAYRKLALALHPDKNGAPGADEAFKMVSKAFQVLSDSNMRAAYDRHGADPESRFGGMSSSSSRGPGFQTHSFGGNAFETEISPEELFNMFFGGNMAGGGGFGAPMFTATFGGPGMTFTTSGPRRRQGQQQQQQQGAAGTRGLLMQLAPMLILFLFSILSAAPNIFTTPPIPEPRYTFAPSVRYNTERTTGSLGIKYHVNSQEFMGHPIAAEIARDDTKRGPQLSKFEENVEKAFTRDLIMQCQVAIDRKHRRKEELIGVFGIGTDWEKVRAIDKEPLEACDRLKKFGIS